jgi:hypothetical protein
LSIYGKAGGLGKEVKVKRVKYKGGHSK